MSKIRKIFICHRYFLIFHRDGMWHDSLMSACEKMEEKTAADVKRCLLVRWTHVEEDDQVNINIENMTHS